MLQKLKCRGWGEEARTEKKGKQGKKKGGWKVKVKKKEKGGRVRDNTSSGKFCNSGK